MWTHKLTLGGGGRPRLLFRDQRHKCNVAVVQDECGWIIATPFATFRIENGKCAPEPVPYRVIGRYAIQMMDGEWHIGVPPNSPYFAGDSYCLGVEARARNPGGRFFPRIPTSITWNSGKHANYAFFGTRNGFELRGEGFHPCFPSSSLLNDSQRNGSIFLNAVGTEVYGIGGALLGPNGEILPGRIIGFQEQTTVAIQEVRVIRANEDPPNGWEIIGPFFRIPAWYPKLKRPDGKCPCECCTHLLKKVNDSGLLSTGISF